VPATQFSDDRGSVFAFDEFELDLPAFELRQNGEPVQVEPQVFEVLAFLVENAGKVLTKDEILDRVWPERYVSEASLNVRVMAARKALGDSGSEQRYIKTVHGRGYRFIGAIRLPGKTDVSPAPPVEPAGAIPSPTAPVVGTSFIGRNSELARIRALANQPSSRLITIAGPGGIGKTRIALELLRSLGEDGHRPLFVALEHVEPHLVPASLAAAVGVQATAEDVTSVLVRYLAASPRTLILDNLEHAVAEARPMVEAILAGAPGSRLIITSRLTLGLAQEWVFRIGGLSLGSPDGGPGEAEVLFLERADRAGAALSSSSAGDDVRELCRLVDGMPLAIELAAALTRYLPVPAIRDLIEADATSLPGTLQDVPTRHQSLSSLFDESLRRLTEQDRAALAGLAAFEGPFDAAAAERIAGASLVQILALVDGSLVQARDGRFDLHPLLRQFLRAADRARADSVGARHAEYYAALVAGHVEALNGRGQLAAVEDIEANSTNVIAAWRWAAANRRVDLIETARRGLFTYLVFRSRVIEAHSLAEAGLAVIDESESPEAAAALYVNHAWVLMRLGQTARAATAVQHATRIATAAEIRWIPGFGGDPRLAQAVFRIGAGDYRGGYAIASRCVELAEAEGDTPGVAFASFVAAASLYRQVDVECFFSAPGAYSYRPAAGETRIDVAERHLRRAVSILEPQEEVWLRALVEVERGLIAGATNQRETSCAHFRIAYGLRRKLDDPQGTASTLMYLADAMTDMGQVEEAGRLHDEMAALLARSSDASGNTELLRSAGIAAATAGDYPRARDLLRQAIETSRAIGFANNVTGSLRALGDVFVAEGNVELGARILAAVAADTSTTPGSRAKARLGLQQLGLEAPPPSPGPLALDPLIDEAVRASVSLSDWLSASYAEEPVPGVNGVLAARG